MDTYYLDDSTPAQTTPSPSGSSLASNGQSISPALVLAHQGSLSPSESTLESPIDQTPAGEVGMEDGSDGLPQRHFPYHGYEPHPRLTSSPSTSTRLTRSISTPGPRQHLHLSLPPKHYSPLPSLSPMYISTPSTAAYDISPVSSAGSHFTYPIFSSPITSSGIGVDADSAATSPQLSSPSLSLPNYSTKKRSATTCQQPGYVLQPIEGYDLAEMPPKSGQSGAGAFVYKVYNMLLDNAYQHLIAWTQTGTSFVISNHTEFAAEVLPKHFKHTNFSSFVRQLNMYGFHKINKTPRGQKGSIEAQSWEFSHPQFLHDRADLLDTIKRKTGTESAGSEGRSIPGTPASPARAGQISPRQQQTILHAQQVAKQEAMQRHSAAQYQQRLTAAGAAGLGSPQLVSPRPQAAATRASVAQQLDRQSPDDAMREVGYWKETCRSLQGALDESRRKEADLTTLVGQLYRALQAAGAQPESEPPPMMDERQNGVNDEDKPSILLTPAAHNGAYDSPTLPYQGYTHDYTGDYRSPSALSAASSYGVGGTAPPSRRSSSQSAVSSIAPGATWTSYNVSLGMAQAITTPLPPSPAPVAHPIGLGVEMTGSPHAIDSYIHPSALEA